MTRAIVLIMLFVAFPWRITMAQTDSRTIKTYMSFAYPVDPANVKTLVDMDISYALSTTLVDWSESRSLSEGLAKPVESGKDKELILQLRPEAKWSDGTLVTAAQVVRSIAHAKQLHDEAMKGLFEMVKSVEAKDEKSILFRLDRPVAQSQILHKLTEPVYGVVFIDDAGNQDLTKTTGPFTLKASSPKELTLVANPHWYAYQKTMPQVVVIRQPLSDTPSDQEGFAGDPWPNLATSSSLMSEQSELSFKEDSYSIWNRSLDRLFFFSPSVRLSNSSGRALIQAMNRHLDRNLMLKGLGGYHLTQQFFPTGYVIYDSQFKEAKTQVQIPEEYKKRPLQLLAAEGRVGGTLQANISAAIKKLTGVEPQFTIVPLNKISGALAGGYYDIAVLTVAVNDPNAEGPVSFLFGFTPPLIRNGSGVEGDFKARIVKARSMEEKTRNAEYRKVFTAATNEGCVLPLFHFSSIVVARNGIDLSSIPTTDETVAFAKIRFK